MRLHGKALRYTGISKYRGIKIATVLYSSISFNNIDTDFSVYRQWYGAVFGIYINYINRVRKKNYFLACSFPTLLFLVLVVYCCYFSLCLLF